jgi:hypothetical protein
LEDFEFYEFNLKKKKIHDQILKQLLNNENNELENPGLQYSLKIINNNKEIQNRNQNSNNNLNLSNKLGSSESPNDLNLLNSQVIQ